MYFFEARDEAFKLASKGSNKVNPVYTKYSPIYIAATSNVKGTMGLYQNYESVLAVGSTGAYGFEAALNNAKKVDLFDINELQRLFFEYMYTAIIYLDYETFIKHFTIKKATSILTRNDLKDLLSEELYSKLYYFLPSDVEDVFTLLYSYKDNASLLLSSLFRTEHLIDLNYLKKNISFYNEEQYYKLQKILLEDRCIIDYRTASLTDLPKEFNDKYDLIILDNILQYYKDIISLETPYAVNMFIQKKLSKLLTEEGVIQVNYGFEVAADAFKKKFNIPYELENPNYIKDLILKREIKEGINIPLVEKWDNYSYSFIPGVEQIEGRNSENLVLTYKKKS